MTLWELRLQGLKDYENAARAQVLTEFFNGTISGPLDPWQAFLLRSGLEAAYPDLLDRVRTLDL